MRTRLLQDLQKKAIRFKGIMALTRLLLTSVSISVQTETMTGTITDAISEPLIGASVLVQGTSTGTITDMDDKHSISVTPGDILVFSYVGMATQNVKIGAQNVINATPKRDPQVLAETVVIGYGSTRKKDLTGSITNVKGEGITDGPATNPLSFLQGEVVGVQIINSGHAGIDPETRIRGISSINGYKPLYVVDGLLNGNINSFNLENIESMEILKDPSSPAILGARGTDGVIIVTTKKAREGQTLVSINTSFDLKKVVDKVDLVNDPQFRRLYSEQSVNQKGAPFDFNGWNVNANWQDEIFQTAFVTNNNISVTGTSPKRSFYLGVGYSYEQGNIKYEKFSKVTISASSDYKITNLLKVDFQFNGACMLPADFEQVLDTLHAVPTTPVYNREYGLYSILPEFQRAQINDPMIGVDLRANMTKAENHRASDNIYGEMGFLKHFNFKTMFSMSYVSNNGRTYLPVMKVYDDTATGGVATPEASKTEVSQLKENETKVQSDYLLTYTNSFNYGNRNLIATAGFTTYYNSLSRLDGVHRQSAGLVIPDDPNKWFISIGDVATVTNESAQWERTTAPMLARVICNYKGKYLFSGPFRRDGSSAFSYTGNEQQNFFSLDGGWLMTEEEFTKDIKWLDMLRIKTSYGTSGNQNLDKACPVKSLLSDVYSAVFDKPSIIYPGYQLSYLPNPSLRWEKVEAWKTDFETNMLRNRLHFEGVYYKKRARNLLAEMPGISETVSGTSSLGEIENMGVEMAASRHDQISDWGCSVSANLTTIKSKVKSLVRDGYSVTAGDKQQSYAMTGCSTGFFYGHKVVGVYQSQASTDVSPEDTPATAIPGDLKLADMSRDSKITPEDRTMIGNPTPDFVYGPSLGINYKNWSLDIDMTGQHGNEIFRAQDSCSFTQFNYLSQRMDHWHGEDTSNSQPLLNSKHSTNNLNSEYYIEDGSFSCIRNMQPTYSLDRAPLARIRLQAPKVYVNIQNLKTWEHSTGCTPELRGSATTLGIGDGSYPVPAVCTSDINLTF